MAFGEAKGTGVSVVPAVPDGRVVGLIVSVWQPMTRVYVAPVPLQPFGESVAVTVIGKVPVWVGVPERTPPVDSDSPVGSEPLASVKFTVPFVPAAVKVWLKEAFAVPVVVKGFVTVTVPQPMTSV